MWLKFWPHADLMHSGVEHLACPSVVRARAMTLHCWHAFWPQNQNCTSRWWRISLTNTLRFAFLCDVLQSLPKDPCLYSNFPCPFTSRSRLFALTTDLQGTDDGPPNIVQVQAIIRSLASWGIKSLLGWFKGIEVWECCSLDLWMIQGGTRQTLPSLDAAVFRFKIRWNSGSSCIAFLKGVTILQRQRSYLRWTYQCPNNAATASPQRNGKTQPTQRLGCITGVLTLSFPYEIPLWSSTKQWNCELASRKSQQHRNPSLTKGKQMSCCRPGGLKQFQQTLALSLVAFSQSLPGDRQSFAHKPEQNQLPCATSKCAIWRKEFPDRGRFPNSPGFGRPKIDSLLPTFWDEIWSFQQEPF